MPYSPTQLMLFFFIYGFFGWCAEVAFAAFREGRFVNRGFLNGPICPIYGFGVVAVVLLLRPVADNLPLLYAGAVAVTTLLEWLTGYVLEKVFHARWWDYSNCRLNIGGYVCLTFSLLWGAACVVVVRVVHPPVEHIVRLLPRAAAVSVACALSATLAIDLAATLATIRRLGRRLRRLNDLAAEIHALSDNIGRVISDGTISAKRRMEGARRFEEARAGTPQRIDLSRRAVSERLEQGLDAGRRRLASLREKLAGMLDERPFGQSRLINAFPHMTSSAYPEALAALREHWARKRCSRKGEKTPPPEDARDGAEAR